MVSNQFLLFLALVFVTAVLLTQGLFVLWNMHRSPEARRIQQRLRSMAVGGIEGVESDLVRERLKGGLPSLDRVLLMLPRVRELDQLLTQAGMNMSPSRLMVLSGVFGVGGLVFAAALGLPWYLVIALGIALATLPTLNVLRRRNQRMRKIEEVLPDTLDLISRALRAGHAFSTALGMVGEDGQEPLKTEFKTTFDEINFGIPTQEALSNMSHRVPSSDLRFFVVAVLIQRETGGNLAEILGNISKLVRERIKLYGKIRVLSAEGKLSAWILTGLPFAAAAIINIVNPNFMSVLWKDPAGLKLVIAMCCMMVFGILWMWRIVKIRV